MGIKADKLVLRTSKKCNFESGLHYFHRSTRLKNILKICKSIGIVGENINV